MRKELYKHVFVPVNGIWTDVSSPEPATLAQVMHSLDMIIDDRTQFARLYDYERGIEIWYRAYGAMRITIDLYPLE